MFFNDKITADSKAAVGWTTAATLEEASQIAQGLVTVGLARCTQVSAPITSTYTWKGQIETETEYRITIKFLSSQAQGIETYLNEHHSYETPQWIWVEASGASEAYGKWLSE